MTSMVATLTNTVQAVETRANELQARFDPIRFLLVLLSLPFIVLGWAARLVYRVVLVLCLWAWSAMEIGWKRAAPKAGP